MALIDDVLFYAEQIANDNRFVYSRWWSPNGNGAGAVSVPYHMDCCIYISYAIYLAKGWTWYNQPYGYYWPHPDQTGYDYFLINTLGCDKYTWPNVPNGLQPGDIIITTPALGHTFMIYDNDYIADNSPGYSSADQVSLKPRSTYGTGYYWYVYRMPGGSGAANLLNLGNFINSSFLDGVKFVWDTTVDPHECKVTGTSTAIHFNSIFMDDIINTPFQAGKTYRLKFSGTNVRFRGYFYDQPSGWSGGSSIASFNVDSDHDFTIPATTQSLIFRLWIPAGVTVNEIVAPTIYNIEQLNPPYPGADDQTGKMPIWMMLNPFL